MNFYNDVTKKSASFNTTDIVKDINLLEPTFRARAELIMADAKAAGHELMITETYRSKQRQGMLFAQHKTKLQNVGVHHYSLALDFAKVINGKASWDGDWTFLAPICKKHQIIWGGDWGDPTHNWSFRDVDHIQMVSMHDQTKLFAETWYPDANYNPYDHLK